MRCLFLISCATDLKFYHDKVGITKSKLAFIDNFKNGICGSKDFKSRRELVKGSLTVYPLYNKNELYGAVQFGEHRFFETIKGGPEQRGSVAKFTNLWIKDGANWKLKRAISYNHVMQGMEKQISSEIILSEENLKLFTGTYLAPKTGTVTITIKDSTLELKAGKMESL